MGRTAVTTVCLGDLLFGSGLELQSSSSIFLRLAADGVDDAKVAGVFGVSSTIRSGSREEDEDEGRDCNGFCKR